MHYGEIRGAQFTFEDNKDSREPQRVRWHVIRASQAAMVAAAGVAKEDAKLSDGGSVWAWLRPWSQDLGRRRGSTVEVGKKHMHTSRGACSSVCTVPYRTVLYCLDVERER